MLKKSNFEEHYKTTIFFSSCEKVSKNSLGYKILQVFKIDRVNIAI